MTATTRWKVSELAHTAGLTVRALHYWDEIGLVSPQRTPSGHRCYTSADVTRLYQVMALRQMGLRLDEIVALFDSNEVPDPQTTLRRHLDVVDAELRQRRELRDRLVRVLEALEREGTDTDVELLLKVIKKMTMFENQLTADQRAWFTQRREVIGEKKWQAALAEWPQLIAQVRAEMDAGTDPRESTVQQLVARWDELAELFIGNEPAMKTAMGKAWRTMWAEHADQLRQSSSVAPPQMWDYIQRARQVS
ncbi:MAG: MerR family transcriptional regulator [Pseudonocardiaceae bacterium]